jgi:RNA polymerase sigma-70 factor (ECF subfamily)
MPVSEHGELHAAGQSAWPTVHLAREVLAAWCAAREVDVKPELAADAYLACACSHGDAAALAAFEERYLSEVGRFLAGTRSTPDTVEEVKQRLRVRLFTGERPRIAEYAARGSLAAWLRVAAVRTASNLRREERAATVGERTEEADAPPLDPDLIQLKERYRADLEQALRLALSHLEPRDRNLLRMHFLERVRLERLASLFGVHRATVVRWLAAARARVIDETFTHLRAAAPATQSELASLVQLLRSQLEVSLRRLLA